MCETDMPWISTNLDIFEVTRCWQRLITSRSLSRHTEIIIFKGLTIQPQHQVRYTLLNKCWQKRGKFNCGFTIGEKNLWNLEIFDSIQTVSKYDWGRYTWGLQRPGVWPVVRECLLRTLEHTRSTPQSFHNKQLLLNETHTLDGESVQLPFLFIIHRIICFHNKKDHSGYKIIAR